MKNSENGTSHLNNHVENGRKKFYRQTLPIDHVRNKIKEILQTSNTGIFIGETGSGKSTQIPQICLEAGISKNMIGVTQPRKVAACALANRVADEMGIFVGETVGYKFRFEDNVGKNTKLAYLTDGILLREALYDNFLSKYSVIIVDEVHERSVHTDILLFILKLAQKQRIDSKLGYLKIFLMSATMQCEKFSKYFDNAPVYYIEGRTYPVELFCAEELSIKNDDYLQNAVTTVLQLHRKEPIENGFLVFLTGQEEIEAACRLVTKASLDAKHRIVPIPLYASVSSSIQSKAFLPVEPFARKVVFSTNIAETSVTIPGIRIVIDSGKVKQKVFSPNSIDILKVVNISKSQAIQRAGRAGREARGKCYRLYSQTDYNNFPENQEPEILRSNLSSVLLELFKMGMKKVNNLKLLDLPNSNLIEAAINELKVLKAIEQDSKGKISVSSIGLELVKFPMKPAFSMILYFARKYKCLEEALTISAFLASENVICSSNVDFEIKNNCENGGNRLGRMYDANEGDHIRMLKIYRAFKTQKKNNKNNLKEWCNSNGFHLGRLESVVKIRKQLNEICRDNRYDRHSYNSDFTPLRKAICYGLYFNVCIYDRTTDTYRLERQPTISVKIHPSSCLARNKVTAFVFTDLVQTTETYARDICLMDIKWLPEIRNFYNKKF